MIASEFTFDTADKTQIKVYKWIPENVAVKGVVQIAHGMAEHAERYAHFAEFLTSQGFAVYANNHRGHGKNSDMGFFASQNGWFIVVDDIHILSQLIAREYTDKPLFILGHSMGSLLTRTYICNYSRDVKGVILSGTAGSPGIVGPLAKFIVFICRILKGKHGRVRLLDNMSFGSFNNKIKKPRTRFDWLSTDTAVVDKYVADPLCGGLFTVQFFCDLLTGLSFIFKNNNLKKIRPDLPVLLISGSQDPVGDFGKGVKQTLKKFKKNGITNVQMKLYEDFRHEILNEVNKEWVYNDIAGWLNKFAPKNVL